LLLVLLCKVLYTKKMSSRPNDTLIHITDISKKYRRGHESVDALHSISLDIYKGELLAIVGPSGSGKTTLTHIVGGLITPDMGTVEVEGRPLKGRRDKQLSSFRNSEVGFIFQNYHLVPNLSALENVMLPMEFAHVPAGERKSRAIELLELVGLNSDKQKRKPGRLSGGEQQRVAIARALANKPKLVLADEPTGNLDTKTGKMIFDLLHKLSRTENTTIIAVTHDLGIAGKTDMSFTLKDGKLQK